MGNKASKDTKEVKSGNQIVENTSRASIKSSQPQGKTQESSVDPKAKPITKPGVISIKQSTLSSEKVTKKVNDIAEEKITIKMESLPVKKLESQDSIRNNNIRGNNPKKQKITTDQLSSKESEALKVIKKHNKDFEDSALIDSLLTRHFFMRVLDKQSR
jgi:hypothetical protein